jgi:hypothetical protein
MSFLLSRAYYPFVTLLLPFCYLYGNNTISNAIISTWGGKISLHFYPIWEAASLDEWLI